MQQIDPVAYGSSRNYLDGKVTYLSPYISRGVISTRQIADIILKKEYSTHQVKRFIQELAWRDYYQRVWQQLGDEIFEDIRVCHSPIRTSKLSKAIVDASTGIEAIDKGIVDLYQTGYMHNHVRMYLASIICNTAQSHWSLPSKWMYYHLLDGDLASNALSWQWVAGANANKKYVANQDNINKYCFTAQKNTFLDVSYEAFASLPIPEVLKDTPEIKLFTPLPKQTAIKINPNLPSCIYNFYNLDPLWKKDISANRILLLEPSHFEQYPVSRNTIDFILRLSKDNIDNLQIYVGEFDTLVSKYKLETLFFKEHPLSGYYQGNEDSRDWMFDVKGYFPSFFGYWKKCKKQIIY